MSYTPPFGSAVNFTASGDSVPDVLGNKVDFPYLNTALYASGQFTLCGDAVLSRGVGFSSITGAVCCAGTLNLFHPIAFEWFDKYKLSGSAEILFPIGVYASGKYGVGGSATLYASNFVAVSAVASLGGAVKLAVITELCVPYNQYSLGGVASVLAHDFVGLTIDSSVTFYGGMSLLSANTVSISNKLSLGGTAAVRSGVRLTSGAMIGFKSNIFLRRGSAISQIYGDVKLGGAVSIQQGRSTIVSGGVGLQGLALVSHFAMTTVSVNANVHYGGAFEIAHDRLLNRGADLVFIHKQIGDQIYVETDTVL